MIVFRTSASGEAGYRRLQRCIYLGAALRNDADILFCVDKDKQALELLREKKFRVCLTSDINHVKQENPAAIVFDLPEFSAFDTQLLEWAVTQKLRTAQFVEWGQASQPTDFVLGPGAVSGTGGLEHAVLHHRYRHFNKSRRKYRSSNRNVLIDLGESLEYRAFREVVDMAARYIKHVKIVPGYFMKKGNKKTLKRIYQNVRFTGKTDSFARAYFEADVALVSPGIEAYQAAAVGTPALYLPVSDGDDAVARMLETNRLGFNLGSAGSLSRSRFKEVLERLSFDTRLEMGVTGIHLVDGRGASRIIDFYKKNIIM